MVASEESTSDKNVWEVEEGSWAERVPSFQIVGQISSLSLPYAACTTWISSPAWQDISKDCLSQAIALEPGNNEYHNDNYFLCYLLLRMQRNSFQRPLSSSAFSTAWSCAAAPRMSARASQFSHWEVQTHSYQRCLLLKPPYFRGPKSISMWISLDSITGWLIDFYKANLTSELNKWSWLAPTFVSVTISQ